MNAHDPSFDQVYHYPIRKKKQRLNPFRIQILSESERVVGCFVQDLKQKGNE